MSPEMRQERISTAGDERARMRWKRGINACGIGDVRLILSQRLGYTAVAVERSGGNDAADTSPRFIDVSLIARNHVDMQVEDRLAGGLPEVDTDVVAVWTVGAFNDCPCVVNSRKQLDSFSFRGLEPVGDVPDRNQERVTRADWKAVPYPVDT